MFIDAGYGLKTEKWRRKRKCLMSDLVIWWAFFHPRNGHGNIQRNADCGLWPPYSRSHSLAQQAPRPQAQAQGFDSRVRVSAKFPRGGYKFHFVRYFCGISAGFPCRGYKGTAKFTSRKLRLIGKIFPFRGNSGILTYNLGLGLAG